MTSALHRIRQWWVDEELDNPITILLRLMIYPIVFIARIIMCLAIVIGWGVEAGNYYWRNTR